MLSNKSVLPNFLKTLTVALFAVASMSVFADGHGNHDKKVGDLKDMGTDAATHAEQAAPELSDLNSAAKEAMQDAAAVEEVPAGSVDNAIEELKSKASSLAEEE